MTDTKPTLEEQIAALSECTNVYTPTNEAILASLKELQSIKSQPVPVEPVCVKKMRRLKNDPTWEVEWMTLGYIDRILSALQVAQMERTAERERGDQWETTATNLLERAEKAEELVRAVEFTVLTGEGLTELDNALAKLEKP